MKTICENEPFQGKPTSLKKSIEIDLYNFFFYSPAFAVLDLFDQQGDFRTTMSYISKLIREKTDLE